MVAAIVSAPALQAGEQDHFTPGATLITPGVGYPSQLESGRNSRDKFGQSDTGSGNIGPGNIGPGSYLSFNQNRRLSAYDGISVDTQLGQLFFTDDTSVSGFTRMNDVEQQYGMGFRAGKHRLNYMQGRGEGFSRLDNQYADLDPYYFHGGTTAAYRFDSLEWAYQLGASFAIQAGTATIKSDYLQDRDTHFIGVQYGALNGHIMQVQRSGEQVGETLSLGFDSPLGNFSVSSLQQVSGGRMNQFAYQFRSINATQYGLSFSTQENPLLDEAQSYRVMIGLSRPLGRINRLSAAEASAQVDPEAEAKSKTNRNIAILGGAAVAAGLLISSGSSSQDRAIRVSDQHAAARNVLNNINPKSVKENREYGGWVYETPDGNYTSTTPIAGTIDSVEIPFSLIPGGGRALASYHTHGSDDPRYVNEQFSPTDIASDLSVGLDGYLGTPAGAFLWHSVNSNQVQRLGSIAN